MRRSLAIGVLALSLLTASAPAFAQFHQQGPKLVGTGAVGAAAQGASVAISADGNTVIVGGPSDNQETGGAWIFTRSNGGWTQQGAKLVGTGSSICHLPERQSAGPSQGGAVAISADGNTALVGGRYDGECAGAVWVFVRSGGTWSQQGPKLVGSTPGWPANQGVAVAISVDGNTALVGGYADDAGTGAAWVFTRSGSTWTEQAKLVGAGTNRVLEQGGSVALSADGNTALVGGTGENGWTGAVWIYTRSGSTWSQQAKLTGDGQNAFFGAGTSLSADGNTAVIGGRITISTGATVRTFTRSGTTWSEQGSKMTIPGAFSPISLSGDARRLLLSSQTSAAPPSTGGPLLFLRNGSAWVQSGSPLVGSGAVNMPFQSGGPAALSSDGVTVISGGRGDNTSTGAAWIFRQSPMNGDADGDGRSDVTVYNTTSGIWSSLTSTSGYDGQTHRGWGGTGYAPVPGDYDADGKADLGVYHEASGNWYVLLSGANFTTVLSKNVGGSGWMAVPGDYDGDGQTDIVVYNTTTGQWYGLLSGTNYSTTININWGGTGYQAVSGDFDGDGKVDIAVYQITSGNWYVLPSSSNYTTSLAIGVGGTGWTPVPADYDGDRKTDFVVFNSSSGQWYGLKSSANYTTTINLVWGEAGSTPVKGDYDADGKADFAVYVESTGAWNILLSYYTMMTRTWGGPGYTAIAQFP